MGELRKKYGESLNSEVRQSTFGDRCHPWQHCITGVISHQFLAPLPLIRREIRRGGGGPLLGLPLQGWPGRDSILDASLHPTGEMDPPQCVEELEDDVFQPKDELGTQPGSLPSADLFAQSQLDCPLSRLQLFPLTHCCGPGLRPISQEDKATQTLSPASPSQGVMLPCGVTEEPQRLFYGECS